MTIVSIGIDPIPATAMRPAVHSPLLLIDVVWWLLESALVLGLLWRSTRPRRTAGMRIALLWVLTSAVRFAPAVLLLSE